jgi:peptidoglycan/LPS O-acetylase OafA/YrhL
VPASLPEVVPSGDAMKRRYFDLLRVLAILAVFATHVTIFCPPALSSSLWVGGHNVSWLLLGPAWGGVWIFFVLAGYLTGKGFSAGRYVLTLAGVRRFWWNRFLRICVPYYFAVFVVVVLTAPRLLDVSGWPTLVRMLTFTYYDWLPHAPLSQTWFVSTLVQLMLLAPLVALALTPLLKKPRLAGLVAIALMLAGTLVRVAPLLRHPGTDIGVWWPSWMYIPVWANLDLFMVGFLVNAATRPPASRTGWWLRPTPVLTAFAALWFVTTWVAFHGLILGIQTSSRVLAIGGPLAWTAITALWICMAEARPAQLVTVGRWRSRWWLLVEAGAAVSYGVYLWHVPILQSISSVIYAPTPIGVWAMLFVSGLALTLAMAAITRVTVERAASRLRRDARVGG